MKTLGKLIAVAAVVLASASAANGATAGAMLTAAAPPWFADTVYYTGGAVTGTTRYYCDGRLRDTGDVWNYDTSVHTVYYECP